MATQLDELLERLHSLEAQLDQEYTALREEMAQRKRELADRFVELQRQQRVGLWRYLRGSRWSVVLTAPIIYAGWPVFALLDGFITLYQTLCFPLYGIARVKRRDYLVFDRTDLPYLNASEAFKCLYCSYGKGVVAYSREVAARTEHYWCPIKHARRGRDAHANYPTVFEHGEAETFRAGLQRLRKRLREEAPAKTDATPRPGGTVRHGAAQMALTGAGSRSRE
jgi:hypothetical protein